MTVCPLSLAQANAYVAAHHRHSRPVIGAKFSLGAMEGDQLMGVAIVGRPVARMLDDGSVLEVTRLCTTGARNAASFLYGAAARATFALGYRKLVTYTLTTEPGTSLRAAGWRVVGEVKGRSWSCPSRPRAPQPLLDKLRWEHGQDTTP